MGVRSLISYEGENGKELLNDFHNAVDDYLKTCVEEVKGAVSLNSIKDYSKQKVVDEYMQDYNPYEKHEPLQFDLRRYAQYVKERNLKPEDITLEILLFLETERSKGAIMRIG